MFKCNAFYDCAIIKLQLVESMHSSLYEVKRVYLYICYALVGIFEVKCVFIFLSPCAQADLLEIKSVCYSLRACIALIMEVCVIYRTLVK